MYRIAAACWMSLLATSAFAQSGNPLTDGAKFHYGIIRGNVLRAAAKVPDDLNSTPR